MHYQVHLFALSYFILFLNLLIFTSFTWYFVNTSCVLPNGQTQCCKGSDNSCIGYIKMYSYKNFYIQSFNHFNKTSFPQRCYCDERCIINNDCCGNYLDACNKNKVDCSVSRWSRWLDCDVKCGRGTQKRYRHVITNPANGGITCPRLHDSRSCFSYLCSNRRVGRSGAWMTKVFDGKAEVANLLPAIKDVQQKIHYFDMRRDIRRKLYLLHLFKNNLTEPSDPNPYCMKYKIMSTNPVCMNYFHYSSSYTNQNSVHKTNFNNGYMKYLTSHIGSYKRNGKVPYVSPSWQNPWINHLGSLWSGHEICVTCYPVYMRKRPGNECFGTGYLGVETRWRAILTENCQGTFMLMSPPKESCKCEGYSTSMIFT